MGYWGSMFWVCLITILFIVLSGGKGNIDTVVIEALLIVILYNQTNKE